MGDLAELVKLAYARMAATGESFASALAKVPADLIAARAFIAGLEDARALFMTAAEIAAEDQAAADSLAAARAAERER
jgi:hypothetical protein